MKLHRALLMFLMVVLVGATYLGGKVRALDRMVPERHRLYGIPVAVSQDVYGLQGYVAYEEIARRFVNDKSIDMILSQDLPAGLDGTMASGAIERPEALFYVPADDKGDVTFTRMAFALFGLRLDSLYKLYFLLLLGSVVAFVLVFHSDAPKLFVGVCVILSVFALLSAFQDGLLRPHVVTLYDVRIYGAIAALAALHLLFSFETGTQRTWIQVVGALYQIFMIVLAVHVRSANMWLVCAVLVYVMVSVLQGVAGRRANRTWTVTYARRMWPLAALVVALGFFLTWERVTYNSRYFSTNLSHHLFWHNAALGFALHPELGKPFDFQISDEAMMRRVARYLLATHSTETIARIFGGAYSSGDGTQAGVRVEVGTFLNSATSDLRLYNETARQIMFETVRTHPLQSAALFLYYKPRYLLSHLLWFTALRYDQPSLDATGHQSPLLLPGDERTRRIYFTPFAAPCLLVFALALAAAWPLSVRESRMLLMAALCLFAFSLLPSLVAYPAPFLMGEALVTLTLALYLGLTMAVVAMSRIPWKSVVGLLGHNVRVAR
jgi:hypothetical protein